jgi:large subunit ribosomal protein L20
MARTKRGVVSRRKHNKLLGQTKGYRMTKSKLVKMAHEASLHAGVYAFHGRKLRKRDFRTLWITRISEACKNEGVSYSVFMNQIKKANVEIDRKIMSDIIVNDYTTFQALVSKVKTA